jgi:hypothetical protein
LKKENVYYVMDEAGGVTQLGANMIQLHFLRHRFLS